MAIEQMTYDTESVIHRAEAMGLDTRILYEAVIELAGEGLLTARCINAGASVLLNQLGLPEYFFRNISKDALKQVLRTVATNVSVIDERVVLRGEVSEARLAFDSGVQIRIATPQNRDRMEKVLNNVMHGNRVHYYYSPVHSYYTYIIYPEQPPEGSELGEDASPFAFTRVPATPRSTQRRYESFLSRCRHSAVPLVEVSPSANTDETRVMFRDDATQSPLPVIRRMLDDLGICLNRAYWETYRGSTGRVESICSLYLAGRPEESALSKAVTNLRGLLATPTGDLDSIYLAGDLSFEEYLFATLAHSFVHTFIHKGHASDQRIMESLPKELRNAFVRRVFDSDRSEYSRRVILEAIHQAPDLVKWLYRLFDGRFNPRREERLRQEELDKELSAFVEQAAVRFADDRTAFELFHFMTRIVTDVLKTNFYQEVKRSQALRLAPSVLDPLVFSDPVYGIFLVVGFYATGTHMRAADVARGGVRLIRVTPSNYEDELDAMPLLNYALGPVAQRLKHKDIAESGAKGVIVPRPCYARDGLNAVLDFTEGILDLVLPSEDRVDYLGQPEMVFFGPDEGTAGFMDAVAARARERGYRYWRTLTTGKSIGIPHDTYGRLSDGRVFGLIGRGDAGTELQVEGTPVLTTTDMEQIYREIGEKIDTSGMTTMGVMATLRTMLEHIGLAETDANLMMTGGPDGDLGGNQIQSFKGRICLVVDGGSILFDPDGLDRAELMRIAFARHTRPRRDSMAYPVEKLGPRGFRVPRAHGRFTLPDGTEVPDGAFFHRHFLTNPESRRYIEAARIQVFVPCGGMKDTINGENVRAFLSNFRELRLIVEGANVFFDETARDVIARESPILQVKDSTANKGGVTCSAIAEVLTSFLLGDRYEKMLVENPSLRADLIRSVFDLITANAVAETRGLLALHKATGQPLHALSIRTSLEILSLQEKLATRLEELLADEEILHAVIRAYVPRVLLDQLGTKRILSVLGRPELKPYRDAIVTKKIASMALYRHAAEWEPFLHRLEQDLVGTVRELIRG